MEWFKFYGTKFIYDDKLSSLSIEQKALWVTLLCVCSINNKGVLEAYTSAALLRSAGVTFGTKEWKRNQNVIEIFTKLGMVSTENDRIIVKNWEIYQQKNLTGYERIKKYREKKRNDNANDNIDDNANDNGRVEKIREDKIRVEKRDYRLRVLSVWNEQDVVSHKSLTKDAQREVDKLCDDRYPLEEIERAIVLYATILKGQEYFWSYKWNLYEFLKRGLKKFEGKKPDDYLRGNNTPLQSTKVDNF